MTEAYLIRLYCLEAGCRSGLTEWARVLLDLVGPGGSNPSPAAKEGGGAPFEAPPSSRLGPLGLVGRPSISFRGVHYMRGEDELESVRGLRDPLARYKAATDRIREIQSTVGDLKEIRALAVAELHALGKSYREIARMAGLSVQRVAQMGATAESASQLLRAWNAVETKLMTLADCAAIGITTKTPAQVTKELTKAGYLDSWEENALVALRTARNKAVHGRGTPPLEELEQRLDDAIALASRLELKVEECLEGQRVEMTDERREAEALFQRVKKERPEMTWVQGRCEECGRGIPVPAGSGSWVCSKSCKQKWLRVLYQVIDPGSAEEATVDVPRVVPYWI